MGLINIDLGNIENHIEQLSRIGNLGKSPSDGFLRASWSKEESTAFEYFKKYVESNGLVSQYDPVGNLFIRIPGEHDKIVQVGSHLDTIPEGGNYDGAAGIIAGIEAIREINGIKPRTLTGAELVIWRGEESATYGETCKGSKAAFGLASSKILLNTFKGKTLEEAIIEQGFDSRSIREMKHTLNPEDIDKISVHLELHIEQGNVLEQKRIDIGNVTSIRGYNRYLVSVEGEFDHSGATPLGVNYRKDANLAMAYIQVRLDELAKKYCFSGNDLVQTVGEVNTNSHINSQYLQLQSNALTKVSGFGYFTLDIRSNNNLFRKKYVSEVEKTIVGTAKEFGVGVQIVEISKSSALESLSYGIQSRISKSCEQFGYSEISMPSGAGHDADVVAKQDHSKYGKIPVGMIFIPCRGGKSHCKEEYASPEAITKGANVLADTLFSLMS